MSEIERAILTEAARGLTAHETAGRLGLAPEIVRSHLVRTIERLGAGSKLEAVIIALRRGLIEAPTP